MHICINLHLVFKLQSILAGFVISLLGISSMLGLRASLSWLGNQPLQLGH